MPPEEIKVHRKTTTKKPKRYIPHKNGVMMDFVPRRSAINHNPRQLTVRENTTEIVEVKTSPIIKSTSVAKPMIITKEKTIIEKKTVPKTVVQPIQRSTPPNNNIVVPPENRVYRHRNTIMPQRKKPAKHHSDDSVYQRPIPAVNKAKSPFLSSVNVEKRPLYDKTIEQERYYEPDHHNVYQRDKNTQKKSIHKTEIIPTRSRRAQIKMSTIALIIATIVVGVVLAIFIYFAIFKVSK